MRTTLNIDDDLYRAVKIKAVTEHRTVTELIDAALRHLLDQSGPMGKPTAARWNAPPFPTIDTKPLATAPPRTASISELNDLAKETELASDLERSNAIIGH